LRSSTNVREVNASLDDPKPKTRLVNLIVTLLAGSPADFDTEKWGKVVKLIGIKAD
jgi:hypothetical protein